MFERPVVGSFGIFGKDAGRQLAAAQVVLQAITTHPFARARLVGAVAEFPIAVFLAFHNEFSW